MAFPVQVVFDCADPGRLASFWAVALNYEVPGPPPGYETWEDLLRAMHVPEDQWNARSAVEDPAGAGPRIFFQQVPEEKVVKNRMHLDIRVAMRGGRPEERRAQIDAHVARLKEAGGSVVRVVEGDMVDPTSYFVVMQDPEGNEFCVT